MPGRLSGPDPALPHPARALLPARAPRGGLLTPGSLLAWTWGLAVLTLLGSLSARKYNRPSLLMALLGAFAAVGALHHDRVVPLLAGRPWPVTPGLLPVGLTFLLLTAVVEKFGQAEGHRAALFAAVGQVAALAGLHAVRAFGPPPVPPPLPLWIELATLSGYLIGANFCAVFYHMLRVLTADRMPWLRGWLALLLGGAVETFVSLPLAYGGREPLGALVAGRLAGWLFLATALLPFVSLHRAASGRRAVP